MMLKTVATMMSPAGPRARLSVLIFHRVLTEVDPLFPDEPDIRRFHDILSWVARWFQVLPLDEAVAKLASGTLPARAAAITFDDGYADNATNALPLLQQHAMVATFFVATSFLAGGQMWNDAVIEAVRHCADEVMDLSAAGLGVHDLGSVERRRHVIEQLLKRIKYLAPDARSRAVEQVVAAGPGANLSRPMMTPQQVLQLRQAGMQIGAHTCTHPILARTPDALAFAEIKDSKHALQEILGEPISLFAYPNGKPGADYDARHVRMVRDAGFSAAVSTAPGVATHGSDLHQLPRFTPWDQTRTRYGLRLLANLRHDKPWVA